jgi:hypothetical protein
MHSWDHKTAGFVEMTFRALAIGGGLLRLKSYRIYFDEMGPEARVNRKKVQYERGSLFEAIVALLLLRDVRTPEEWEKDFLQRRGKSRAGRVDLAKTQLQWAEWYVVKTYICLYHNILKSSQVVLAVIHSLPHPSLTTSHRLSQGCIGNPN